MADKKISALPAATTPLTGAEVLPVVQGGVTDQVSVANLTAGRDVTVKKLNATDNLVVGTAGKGIVDSTNAVALNFSSSGATLNSTLSQTGAINIVTNDFSSHVTAMNLNDTLTITGLTTGVIEISEMTFWQNLAVIAVNGASTAIVYASDAAITVSSGNAGTINVYRSGANVIIESKNAATLSVRTNIRKLG